MDVERIQKINNLALDLMRQGLASDRADAIAQAEKIFRQKDGDYTSIRERMEEIRPETKTSSSSSNTNDEDLPQEKIKEILEKNTKFLVAKIREFQEKVASMEREIAGLKTQMTFNRGSSVREVAGDSNKPRIETVDQRAVPPPQAIPASHPRSGNYGDSDVSIEKFFYMGSK